MGADDFLTISRGVTAEKAFDEAIRRAEYDYGCVGHTGTIAEKVNCGFTMITPPDGGVLGVELRRKNDWALNYARELISDCDFRIDDKWGPAGCIELDSGLALGFERDVADPDVDMRKFLFFGWGNK